MDDVEERLAARYGRRPDPAQRRRSTLRAAVVVGVLGSAILIWVAFGVARVPVRTVDVGFDVVAEDAVDVTFDVVKAPTATAVCRVRALNPQFAEVGVKDVTVEPAADRVVRVTVRVLTFEEATTGLVQHCRILPESPG